MPPRRTETPSAPTILRWLKIYHSSLPKLVKSGGLYPEHGKRVAKGLKYAIKALEDSKVEYQKEKRRLAEDDYQESLQYMEEL